jgi:hypothetical protein
MTKILNQIIFFFLHQNQNIFFSNNGNQNIFLEKNHNPPPLQVKWSVPYNNCKSANFSCDIGMRQGENLFPFLFALFLNLPGLKTISEKIEENCMQTILLLWLNHASSIGCFWRILQKMEIESKCRKN